jgi:hypothetical protein
MTRISGNKTFVYKGVKFITKAQFDRYMKLCGNCQKNRGILIDKRGRYSGRLASESMAQQLHKKCVNITCRGLQNKWQSSIMHSCAVASTFKTRTFNTILSDCVPAWGPPLPLQQRRRAVQRGSAQNE